MAVTLGVFAVAAYVFFAHSLYRQLDHELLTLAKAAAPSLAIAKKEIPRSLNEDISWRDLFKKDQSLEWYNQNRQLLARVGAIFSQTPLGDALEIPQQSGQIRSLSIPVYGSSQSRNHLKLEGYVRVSESTQAIEENLAQLGWGMGLGGIIALGLSAIGGIWLTWQSIKPIEQSFQQLKQFTADASHELRSPLTAVKTSVEVMLNHPERVHPKDAKKLRAIASATNQMVRLVEDLLFLARTDAATVALMQQPSPLPLDEVLQEIIELLEPQIHAQDITLNVQLLTGVTVLGNATQLTRLFSNLLENALQYTPNGGTVTLSMSSFDRVVFVSVEDTGMGIAAEHLPLVFNRFWRADKARSHRDGGLGLGLALAQMIARSHGGEITVISQVGTGSCFRVRLPIV